MKAAMPSIAARPLIISALAEKTSPRPAPSYAFMVVSLMPSGKYPWGLQVGTREAPAIPATVRKTRSGYLAMSSRTSPLKVFWTARTKPTCC